MVIRYLCSPMTQSARGHIAVLLTNIFFAVNYSVIKTIAPDPFSPYALNILRVGISVVLFWTMWLAGKSPAGIQKKDLVRFLACGVTGIALNQTLFLKGLTLTSTIHASLLILITPVLVTVFALWVLRERFSATKAAGLFLAVSGASFLIMQREHVQAGNDFLLGDLLILLNAVSYSIYFIAVKPLTFKYDPLHVIRWVFTIGLFMVLPIGWEALAQTNWQRVDAGDYVALLAVSIPGTFLAYYLNAYGIKTIGAGNTGTYIYLQPFIVVVIAIFFLGENFTWQKFIAGMLIISGVYLVGLKPAQPKVRAAA